MVATRWTDRSPIYFLSNAHVPEVEGLTVLRHDKKGNELQVNATPSVKEYNAFMGGVDLNDKMTRLDKSRKAYKWYSRIDRKCFMWALYNSYILYKQSITTTPLLIALSHLMSYIQWLAQKASSSAVQSIC